MILLRSIPSLYFLNSEPRLCLHPSTLPPPICTLPFILDRSLHEGRPLPLPPPPIHPLSPPQTPEGCRVKQFVFVVIRGSAWGEAYYRRKHRKKKMLFPWTREQFLVKNITHHTPNLQFSLLLTQQILSKTLAPIWTIIFIPCETHFHRSNPLQVQGQLLLHCRRNHLRLQNRPCLEPSLSGQNF